MEVLYKKLYEKYSKLKTTKDNQMEQINKEQEVTFVDYVSAAESYIKHLEGVNKRLSENIDELRDEVVSVRSALDQQFHEFQEEKQKNQQLALVMEQLQNRQHERTVSNNRSDQHEEQHVNSNCRSPSVSHSQIDETPMRMTRKRTSLLEESDTATISPAVGHVHLSGRREHSIDRSKSDISKTKTRKSARLLEESDTATISPAVGHVHLSGRSEHSIDLSTSDLSKTKCCQVVVVNGGPCKCMFQGLLEYLFGMKLSAADRPEGKCLNFIHPPSGYSFSLTWINKPALSEVELMYNVISLGTFAAVAPEWMKEVIMFSVNMFPTFFERLSRVTKAR